MSRKFFQDMTVEEVAAMTDEDVKAAAYGIRQYNPAFGTPAQRANYAQHIEGLRARLDGIEAAQRAAKAAARAAAAALPMATCAVCRGQFPAHQAMSSSVGSVCPRCYEMMND